MLLLELESLVLLSLEVIELGVLNESPDDLLDHINDLLRLVRTDSRDLLACLILDFQELREVLLKAVHSLLQVHDVLIDRVESSLGVLPVFNLDLDESHVLSTLLSEFLGLVDGVRLLAAHFDGCLDIKDGAALRLLLPVLNQLRDLIVLLGLHVAVQEESRVILVVVAHRIQILDGLSLNGGCLDQVLKVLDQVWKLLDFNISLDDVAWVQVPDGLDVLHESLVILLLDTVELIGVFFADFCLDLLWEVGTDRDTVGFLKHSFL